MPATLPEDSIRLRRKALELPGAGAGAAHVMKPVVQAVGTPLPEFEFAWRKRISSPERGRGDVAALVFGFECAYSVFQRLAAVDDRALMRSPRADPAPARARREIGLRFVARQTRGCTADAHLPFESRP